MTVATVALMRHGGSHLIRPIVAKMGFDIREPGNFDFPIDEAEGPVVVFLRDPRDRMAASLRWWMERGKGDRYGESSDEQLAGMLTEGGFIADMTRWAGIWCKWPGSLTVRFEDLRSDGVYQVSRIARHLGVDCDAAAIFNEVYGKGRTYTGRHSNWVEHFGPLSIAAWSTHGGPDLLETMGYE